MFLHLELEGSMRIHFLCFSLRLFEFALSIFVPSHRFSLLLYIPGLI